MEIRLIKYHDGSKAGSTLEVSPEAANYLVRCKVAEYTGEQPKEVVKAPALKPKTSIQPKKTRAKKEAKVVKPNLEKK